MLLSIIYAAVVLVCCTHALPAEDEIHHLPGWDGPLPSRMFSGYLEAKDSRLFYWFVQGENVPTSDVTIWFNGGPGCSSLGGFWTENGPFELSEDGKRLYLREYRWSRIQNMLYIENPVGVGLSYSTTRNYNTGDLASAEENMLAVKFFFEHKFPELSGAANALHLAGESYAGLYIPLLSKRILEEQDAGRWSDLPVLKTIAVGNGCVGNSVGACAFDSCDSIKYHWAYLSRLSYISPATKAAVASECDFSTCGSQSVMLVAPPPASGFTGIDDTLLIDERSGTSLSAQCIELLSAAQAQLNAVNIYNVQATCVENNGCSGFNATAGGAGAGAGAGQGSRRRAQMTPHSASEMVSRLAQGLGHKRRLAMQQGHLEQRRTEAKAKAETEAGARVEVRAMAAGAPSRRPTPKPTSAMPITPTPTSEPTNNLPTSEPSPATMWVNGTFKRINAGSLLYVDDDFGASWASDLGINSGPQGCIDSIGPTAYMMDPAVQAAIHAMPTGFCWSFCNTAAGWNYTREIKDETKEVYPYLIGRISVLIYNGDLDNCVPYTDNLGWIESMGLPIKRPWHPWYYSASSEQVDDPSFSSQLGGYMEQMEIPAGYQQAPGPPNVGPGPGGAIMPSFHFATVRGAGHMVPQDQPAPMFSLYARYLNLGRQALATGLDAPSPTPSWTQPSNSHSPKRCHASSSSSSGSTDPSASFRPDSNFIVIAVLLGLAILALVYTATGWSSSSLKLAQMERVAALHARRSLVALRELELAGVGQNVAGGSEVFSPMAGAAGGEGEGGGWGEGEGRGEGAQAQMQQGSESDEIPRPSVHIGRL